MLERQIRGDGERNWEAAISCTPINVSTSGVNAVLAAVAGQRVYCHGFTLVPAAAVTLTLEDTDGTNILGPVDLAAKQLFHLPANQLPEFFTASGKGLQILLGGAVQVGGMMLLTQY